LEGPFIATVTTYQMPQVKTSTSAIATLFSHQGLGHKAIKTQTVWYRNTIQESAEKSKHLHDNTTMRSDRNLSPTPKIISIDKKKKKNQCGWYPIPKGNHTRNNQRILEELPNS